jgi:hypothetical protein
MRTFTDDELMQRVWDTYEIKNLMGRHAYYHAYNLHRREMEELWPRLPENRETASFGQNWGYQVGYDLIWRNYVEVNEKNNIRDLRLLREKDPTVEITPENYMLGQMLMHCLTAPLVEIAGDGKTAQGMWYAPGHITFDGEDGSEGVWMYERYGADFIREPDGWKLWHLFIGTDFALPAGRAMADEPVDQPPFDLNDEDEETNMILTYPFEAYTSRYNFSAYPPVPQPYETFADTVSNGPEGNPRFQEVQS